MAKHNGIIPVKETSFPSTSILQWWNVDLNIKEPGTAVFIVQVGEFIGCCKTAVVKKQMQLNKSAVFRDNLWSTEATATETGRRNKKPIAKSHHWFFHKQKSIATLIVVNIRKNLVVHLMAGKAIRRFMNYLFLLGTRLIKFCCWWKHQQRPRIIGQAKRTPVSDRWDPSYVGMTRPNDSKHKGNWMRRLFIITARAGNAYSYYFNKQWS